MDHSHQLLWIRENILQHLSQVDRVLALLVPMEPESSDHLGDEPWLHNLFEKRHNLRLTLCQVERQLERQSLPNWPPSRN